MISAFRPFAEAVHDPFPSATVHSATVHVDPIFVDLEAKHFDPAKNSRVVDPLTSKIYDRFAGIRHLEQLGISQPKAN